MHSIYYLLVLSSLGIPLNLLQVVVSHVTSGSHLLLWPSLFLWKTLWNGQTEIKISQNRLEHATNHYKLNRVGFKKGFEGVLLNCIYNNDNEQMILLIK